MSADDLVRTIAAGISDAVWVTDADYRLAFANAACLRWLGEHQGVPANDWVGRNVLELFNEPRIEEWFRRARQNGVADLDQWVEEHRVWTARLQYTGEGYIGTARWESSGAYGSVIERRLRETSDDRRALLAQGHALAGLGSWTWDVGNGRLWLSPEAAMTLGVPEATTEWKPMARHLVDTDRVVLRDALQAALAAGGALAVEVRWRRDGEDEPRILAVRAERLRDHTGSWAGHRILGTLQDITAQRRHERLLQETVAHYQLAIQGDREALYFRLDPEGRILDVQGAVEPLFRVAPAEVVGLELVSLVSSDIERDALRQQLEAARHTPGPTPRRTYVLGREGAEARVIAAAVSAVAVGERLQGYVGIAWDLTSAATTTLRASLTSQVADVLSAPRPLAPRVQEFCETLLQYGAIVCAVDLWHPSGGARRVAAARTAPPRPGLPHGPAAAAAAELDRAVPRLETDEAILWLGRSEDTTAAMRGPGRPGALRPGQPQDGARAHPGGAWGEGGGGQGPGDRGPAGGLPPARPTGVLRGVSGASARGAGAAIRAAASPAGDAAREAVAAEVLASGAAARAYFRDAERWEADRVACIPINEQGEVLGVLVCAFGGVAPRSRLALSEAMLIALAQRVAAAVHRQREADARQEAEARYRRLYAQFPMPGVIVGLSSGQILDANDAMLRRYGWPVEALRAMTLRDLEAPAWNAGTELRPTPGDRPGHPAGQPQPPTFPSQARHRSASSEVFDVTLTAVDLGDGHAGSAVVFIEDRTAALRAEAYHDRLMQTERLALAGEMAATVAHEVSHPLQSVMMLAHVLEATQGPRLTEEARTQLRMIGTEAHMAAQAMRAILDTTRVAGDTAEEADLAEVARMVLDARAYVLEAAGIALLRHLPQGLAPIRGDSAQIGRVILNLVENARHALRHVPGGRIEVRVQRGADAVTCTVTDNGPGIPEAAEARIFERGFTTKPPGEGSGFGLAIARSIATAHGGSLGLRRPAMGGASFELRLPLAAR